LEIRTCGEKKKKKKKGGGRNKSFVQNSSQEHRNPLPRDGGKAFLLLIPEVSGTSVFKGSKQDFWVQRFLRAKNFRTTHGTRKTENNPKKKTGPT